MVRDNSSLVYQIHCWVQITRLGQPPLPHNHKETGHFHKCHQYCTKSVCIFTHLQSYTIPINSVPVTWMTSVQASSEEVGTTHSLEQNHRLRGVLSAHWPELTAWHFQWETKAEIVKPTNTILYLILQSDCEMRQTLNHTWLQWRCFALHLAMLFLLYRNSVDFICHIRDMLSFISNSWLTWNNIPIFIRILVPILMMGRISHHFSAQLTWLLFSVLHLRAFFNWIC